MRVLFRIVLQAIVLAVLAGIVALVFNGVRKSGIPLFADRPYEIFVPCPEPLGEITEMTPVEVLQMAAVKKVLLIDAGNEKDFAGWHPEGAWNIPFDYILPVLDDDLKKVASSGVAMVIVYGDGGEPDSGREMARELAGRGIRNVACVTGGAQALKAAQEAK